MRIPLDLDRTLAQPLADQLAARLREALSAGRIPRGARLPSSRALADQLGVARNTVVRAYEILTMEGVVESRHASGFYAASVTRATTPQLALAPIAESMPRSRHPPLPETPLAPSVRFAPNRSELLYDFVPSRPNAELFPLKTWRRLLQGCLAYGASSRLADYGDPGGLETLRVAIAAHLSVSRGIVADPAQVLILTGIQEGLSLVARLFAPADSTVVVEDPCYANAAHALASAGARLEGVAVDEDGLVVEKLPEREVALVYVTPAHQFPTGYTLSPGRRQALVEWAMRAGAYIVEDDYASEFQHEGSPLQAIAGMAPDCTLYLGTFSTTLGAGLRLGFAVVPPALIDALRAAKAHLNGGNAWLEQAVLGELLRTGSYAAHVTRCRAQYRESRDALLAALRRNFGSVDTSGEAAGLHVFWRLPAGVPEASRLEQLGRMQRVGIYSLASAGARELVPTTLGTRGVLLGYAGLRPKQIEQGILRLSDAVDDALDAIPDLISELMLDEPPRRRAPSLRGGRAPGLRRAKERATPAIRTISRPAISGDRTKEPSPMRMVRGIYRYPVKGLSAQPLPGVELEANKPFPFDRIFALARPGVPLDPEAPRWAKKGLFLMLMLDEALAQVDTELDVETFVFRVFRGARGASSRSARELVLEVDLTSPTGRAAVETFFKGQVRRLTAEPRLVHAPGGHFMDKPDNVMSCINLATVRSLEAEWGVPVHPLRFRANFYIEGARPWEEFDWVGSDILLGDVVFRVDRRNGRCSATNVNPVSGERDLDIPGALRKRFGHKDLGVYLVARTNGKVVVGDQVSVPEVAHAAHEAPTFVVPREGSFICRGCYYVYVQTKGAPGVAPGTSFAAIPEDFACPDCGTGKSSFRPYLPELTGSETGANAS
ncbi:MAG TPA: aminotransferase class I/II-fold pyridoxal phosphate-dependent enzyme [Polyangiaceae bacterium]|nr:aminotransferase class I/II-fold pyridoxal phosphate-dependent enzyme [Polyangiaceae bacterium]